MDVLRHVYHLCAAESIFRAICGELLGLMSRDGGVTCAEEKEKGLHRYSNGTGSWPGISTVFLSLCDEDVCPIVCVQVFMECIGVCF